MRAARDSEVAAGSIGLDLVLGENRGFRHLGRGAGAGRRAVRAAQRLCQPDVPLLAIDSARARGDRRRRRIALGPLVGALIVVLLPELLSALAEYRLLVFGALLLAVLWLAPLGIVGAIETLAGRLRRPHEPARARPRTHLLSLKRAFERGWASGGLKVEDLAMTFGGVRAVQDL